MLPLGSSAPFSQWAPKEAKVLRNALRQVNWMPGCSAACFHLQTFLNYTVAGSSFVFGDKLIHEAFAFQVSLRDCFGRAGRKRPCLCPRETLHMHKEVRPHPTASGALLTPSPGYWIGAKRLCQTAFYDLPQKQPGGLCCTAGVCPVCAEMYFHDILSEPK